jgi:hypothetical protein
MKDLDHTELVALDAQGRVIALGLGSKPAAKSLPVAIASDQTLNVTVGAITSITNPVTVQQAVAANLNATVVPGVGATWNVSFNGVPQPVSVGNFPAVQNVSFNGLAQPVSVGNFPAVQNVSFNGVTQPVTAAQGGAPWSQNVTQFGGNAVVTGTGASGAGIPRVTVANDSALASVGSITNPVTVAQAAAANLNATVVGTVGVNNFPAVQNVSFNGVPQPVTAAQGGAPWSQNLIQVGGAPFVLGQAVSAASLPVVIASDQSAVPVSVGAIALPANASQESGGNLDKLTQLISINTQILAELRALRVMQSSVMAVDGGIPDPMMLVN